MFVTQHALHNQETFVQFACKNYHPNYFLIFIGIYIKFHAIFSHELGHSLGMEHDGSGVSKACESNKYIMSPTTGAGKTTWSSCSSTNLKDFIATGDTIYLFIYDNFKCIVVQGALCAISFFSLLIVLKSQIAPSQIYRTFL